MKTHSPIPGFTADVFGRFLQRTAFDPWKTLALVILSHYTNKGRELAEQHPRALKTLQVLAILSVARRLNAFLNRRAINNRVRDYYNWNREVVVLTGGANGIGRQMVDLLGGRGIKVAVLDIQAPKDELPSTARFFECDITSSTAIGEVASRIRASLGEPTILINNAAILSGKTILEATEAQTRLMFEVNTLAHYHLAREFLPYMIRRNHGMVVTVASQAAYMTTPNMVDYSASKAAAVSFHEGLAAELVTRYKAPKVRTVLMTQGFTKTGLIDVLRPEDTWFNPLLKPESVAETVVGMVLKGESGHAVIPGSSGWLTRVLRSWPWWMQNGLRNGTEKLMGS